ncbi:MAG: hypothetical protein KDC34_07175 [Saprospiraceae bacterium]|nr:hypothetical protein [Saprospiraceae bacterium]
MKIQSNIKFGSLCLILLFAFLGERQHAEISNDSLELSAIRYKKGLELLRVLHEKLLELDYHFALFLTDYAVGPTDLQLSTNPVISEVFYARENLNTVHPAILAALLIREGNEAEQDELLCHLDYAIRVYECIHTIRIETEFLRASNQLLQTESEKLFEDYTRFLNYKESLVSCRQTDGWELLYLQVDEYVLQIRRDRSAGNMDAANRAHINLEFSVDRLLAFLDRYRSAIRQGRLYYYKFNSMLEPWTQTNACWGDIPESIKALRNSIQLSAEKFHSTYDLTELEGSRLKDLLYGY